MENEQRNSLFENIISMKELGKLRGGEYVLIDIRDKEDYNFGHIPGAIHMDDIELIRAIKNGLYKGKVVIIYCDYGNHGLRLISQLKGSYDMSGVYNIVGGYAIYRGPIEKY